MDGGTITRYSGVFCLSFLKLLTTQYHVTFYAYFRGNVLSQFICVALETGPVVSSNWLNQEVVDDGDMTYT